MKVSTREKGLVGFHEVEMVVKDWMGEKRGEGRWRIEVKKP
jgi:hypothetical protein